MRRIFLPVCLTFVSASLADAQIIRAPSGDPPIVVYTSIGFLQAETIFDGSSGSAWDFGSALQLRASLEKRISHGASLGVSFARASMPLRYFLIDPSVPPATGCSCNASTNLTTVAVSFSAAGGYGFHQILNLGVGVNIFDQFREDGTNRPLAPISGDKDFYLSFGYGLGFGLSNHFAIALVQDYGIILHQRTGLSADRDTFKQLLATRLGFRLALGK